MRVTQQELHEIAQIGRGLLNRYDALFHSLRSLIERVARREANAQELFDAIDQLQPADLSRERSALAAEEAHYLATHRKNEREAAYRERRSGKEGSERSHERPAFIPLELGEIKPRYQIPERTSASSSSTSRFRMPGNESEMNRTIREIRIEKGCLDAEAMGYDPNKAVLEFDAEFTWDNATHKLVRNANPMAKMLGTTEEERSSANERLAQMVREQEEKDKEGEWGSVA